MPGGEGLFLYHACSCQEHSGESETIDGFLILKLSSQTQNTEIVTGQ